MYFWICGSFSLQKSANCYISGRSENQNFLRIFDLQTLFAERPPLNKLQMELRLGHFFLRRSFSFQYIPDSKNLLSFDLDISVGQFFICGIRSVQYRKEGG
jgi:hypothetical protein